VQDPSLVAPDISAAGLTAPSAVDDFAAVTLGTGADDIDEYFRNNVPELDAPRILHAPARSTPARDPFDTTDNPLAFPSSATLDVGYSNPFRTPHSVPSVDQTHLQQVQPPQPRPVSTPVNPTHSSNAQAKTPRRPASSAVRRHAWQTHSQVPQQQRAAPNSSARGRLPPRPKSTTDLHAITGQAGHHVGGRGRLIGVPVVASPPMPDGLRIDDALPHLAALILRHEAELRLGNQADSEWKVALIEANGPLGHGKELGDLNEVLQALNKQARDILDFKQNRSQQKWLDRLEKYSLKEHELVFDFESAFPKITQWVTSQRFKQWIEINRSSSAFVVAAVKGNKRTRVFQSPLVERRQKSLHAALWELEMSLDRAKKTRAITASAPPSPPSTTKPAV